VGKIKQSDNDLDLFLIKMKPQVDSLKIKLEDAKEKLRVLNEDIKFILKYYAITDPDTGIVTFWKNIILQFMEIYDKAVKDNEMDKIKKPKGSSKRRKKRNS